MRADKRSIPACAGEPTSSSCPSNSSRVYPRVCGGTSGRRVYCGRGTGLSPRVRGNLCRWFGVPPHMGSIPACAGEPGPDGAQDGSQGVYPRVCGGTGGELQSGVDQKGLSPRVRGNPHSPAEHGGRNGSIPACAGEPRAACAGCQPPPVYPRVCGGTILEVVDVGTYAGLSPRVRGNPIRHMVHQLLLRSIPACAGEPSVPAELKAPLAVYPRVCGGTVAQRLYVLLLAGLSPRVRGNQRPDRDRPDGARSIPACAGEPEGARPARKKAEVYPRVCGGTVDVFL